ncbi:MAG: PAC2 family protein [Halobacteria archaeon]|nr:PAC2 family protein [Halobacteria archaeon]
MSSEPSYDITYEGGESNTLVIGFSELGMAGLTAVDYLVGNLELEEAGHVTTSGIPSITPFAEGKPRHHTRFFPYPDGDMIFLAAELFLPLWYTDKFADEIFDWASENDVNEIVFLSGIPVPHAPEQHDVFYVATDDFREKYLGDTGLKAMGGGFLEGVNANLVNRGIDSPLAVGVLTTPIHPPAQDIEASLRLVNTFSDVYSLGIDTEPLEEYAEQVQDYYNQLSSRLNAIQEHETRSYPEDRTFM